MERPILPVFNYLNCCDSELLQSVLQPLHLPLQLLALHVEQLDVQVDQLKEGFRCCVVVTALVRKVGL